MFISKCEQESFKNIQDEIFCLLPYKTTTRSSLMFESEISKNIPIKTPLKDLVVLNKHTQKMILETFEKSFQCYDSRFAEKVPNLTSVLFNWAHRRDERLLRVQVVTLDPTSEIPEHIDEGYYYTLTKRYHLVVKSDGSVMEENKVKTLYREGDFFYLENRRLHRAYNPGKKERVHVIFDTLPFSFTEKLKRLYESSFLFSIKDRGVLFFIFGLRFLFISQMTILYEKK